MPPLPATVPEVESHLLDPHDLPGSFERAAKTVAAEVHRINGNRVPPELVAELVERYGVKRAVISAEPEAAAVADELRALAVEVEPLSIEAAARADLGVTSASYGLATTGTVVQESAVAGGRTASLLPPVHLCVLPASRLVPSTSAVLRTLGAPGRLPSNLVLITGPSRSGDIEQIITLGVHGPTALHIALLEEVEADQARRLCSPGPQPPGVLKCASSEQVFWRSPRCSQSPRAATTAAAAAATPAGAAVANFGDCDITVDKGELGDVQLTNDGELTVATNLPAPGFWNGDDPDSINGGFEYCMAADMATSLGLDKVKVVQVSFDALVAGQTSDFDIALSQVTITDERAKVVDFSTPYFSADQGVLVNKGTTIANIDEAKKAKWGVQASTTAQTYLADVVEAGQRGVGVPGHAVDVRRAHREADRRRDARHLDRPRAGRAERRRARGGRRSSAPARSTGGSTRRDLRTRRRSTRSSPTTPRTAPCKPSKRSGSPPSSEAIRRISPSSPRSRRLTGKERDVTSVPATELPDGAVMALPKPAPHVRTYLLPSVFALVLFFPTAIPGIVHGAKARRLVREQNTREARIHGEAAAAVVLDHHRRRAHGLVLPVRRAQHLPERRRRPAKVFLNWDVIKDSFPGIRKGFWLNVKLFMVTEVLVLLWALFIAILRGLPGRRPAPIRFLAVAYIDLFRALPAIIVIYMVVLGLPLPVCPSWRTCRCSGSP